MLQCHIASKRARGYVNPLIYECIKNQWSWLPGLPYGHFSLVTVFDRKQLLAIEGSVNNKLLEY